MDTLQLLSQQLQSSLNTDNGNTRSSLYSQFLHKIIAEKIATCPSPNFPTGLHWINTSEPLSISGSLRGKVIVLDFWTYCCVNCLHILPDLHEIEQKFSVEDGVVVVGVHSAKFPNERLNSNIENAVCKYGITHPVVNDSEAVMWRELGIQCWPTVVIISPTGQLLAQFIGEGHKEEMIDFISSTLDVYSDSVEKNNTLPITVGESFKSSFLMYPSKVCVNDELLIISDTGNHRVVICSLNGNIQKVVGCGSEGCKDGSFTDCSFTSPQGLCQIGDVIYVADSHSHHIRTIDLKNEVVATLAGTGHQGRDVVGGKIGCEQALSTPWDIIPYSSAQLSKAANSTSEADTLLIAMAGSHQIWAYFLKSVVWWKNRAYEAGTCLAIVGSGNEENRNNSYPQKAALAQPSGLTLNSPSNMCYIADSESSTVRQLSLNEGQVKGLAGGERDPMNLFAYGDVDGKGIEAKLQHPLGVCHIPDSDHIIICDSYNHKLKLMNTKTRIVTTLPVQGLSEPGGVSYHPHSRTLYIADTNNHCIKTLVLPSDLTTLSELNVEKLSLTTTDDMDSPRRDLFDHSKKSVIRVTYDSLQVSSHDKEVVTISYNLPEDSYLTEEAESQYRVTFRSTENQTTVKSLTEVVQPCKDKAATVNVCTELSPADVKSCEGMELTLELLLYYCSKTENVCKRMCVIITQFINFVK